MKQLLVVLAATFATALPALSADNVPQPTQNPNAPYRIFRSQNVYTFLKLDTRTGQVWQVQWSLDNQGRFTAPINLKPLVRSAEAGRFTLYPTSNIYTFILLDQKSGSAWQLQWGEKKDRLIIPID